MAAFEVTTEEFLHEERAAASLLDDPLDLRGRRCIAKQFGR